MAAIKAIWGHFAKKLPKQPEINVYKIPFIGLGFNEINEQGFVGLKMIFGQQNIDSNTQLNGKNKEKQKHV